MNLKYKKIISLILIFIACYFILNVTVASASVSGLLEEAGQAAQYDTNKTNFAELVGLIIKAFLSLLGVIFVILIIYGGYLWMTARGNDEQVKKAGDNIRNAVIGLIIIVAAYAITWFVLYNVAKNYTNSGF